MRNQPSSGGFFERIPLPGASAALTMACVGVVGQILLLISHVTFQMELIPVALMSLTVLSTAFLGDENGDFDLRQPWSALMLFHIPFWIIGTIKTVMDPEQQYTWLAGAASHLQEAMLLISAGFLAIAIGYRLGVMIRIPGSSASREPKEWDTNRLVVIALSTYAITWFSRWIWYTQLLSLPFVEMIEKGAPAGWIRTFADTVPNFLMVATWAAYYHKPEKRLLALGWLLTGGNILWGIIYGVMKSLLFMPIFLPILPYIVQKGKVPWSRIGFGAIFLLVLVYPYVTAIREEYFVASGPGRSDAVLRAFESGPIFSLESEQLSDFANKALDRVNGVGSLCQILQLEENGVLDINGVFYLRALYGLVPRVLWREKPILHEGVYFSAYLDGLRGVDSIDPTTIYGSVAPTLFGSFYWNLGWPGLVFTSLAIGILSGISYRYLKQVGLSYPSIFLYYSAILAILDTTETEFVKLPSSLVIGLFLVWVANRFLSKSGTRQRNRPKPLSGFSPHVSTKSVS